MEREAHRPQGERRRPEHRIASFIAKHQIGGEQDWRAKWISFRAVAQYCETLRTPRLTKAGQTGVRFAYAELMKAVEAGEFNVRGAARVLLLVDQGGKFLSITPTELLEAREAFEPEIFIAGYMEKCWAPAGLIARWFSRRRIPPPLARHSKATLKIGPGRPPGAIDHAIDLEVIGRALELQHQHKISGGKVSIRKALTIAINERGAKGNQGGEETDRLRTKLRKRLNLRKRNKTRTAN